MNPPLITRRSAEHGVAIQLTDIKINRDRLAVAVSVVVINQPRPDRELAHLGSVFLDLSRHEDELFVAHGVDALIARLSISCDLDELIPTAEYYLPLDEVLHTIQGDQTKVS